MPAIDSIAVRIVLLPESIVLIGVAAAAYIGAGLGPGPREAEPDLHRDGKTNMT